MWDIQINPSLIPVQISVAALWSRSGNSRVSRGTWYHGITNHTKMILEESFQESKSLRLFEDYFKVGSNLTKSNIYRGEPQILHATIDTCQKIGLTLLIKQDSRAIIHLPKYPDRSEEHNNIVGVIIVFCAFRIEVYRKSLYQGRNLWQW
ncbi:hypothetical protein RhiirC2_714714 [Rhizophagus irregularis]|uniref:Uncharacterized protein n=1 Tax=Rhizophagus irregularis TaxID=588596 RepID=A0A2N1MYB1_9GLOM|nr:hypothetical protein RhiirC2_714714 [Rhizophagus irregularis]